MGSTRLPGKVLMPVAGRPLLWHVIHRLKKSRRLDQIVIATSSNPLDDAIVAFAEKQGVAVVRGPEDDVLARFALAAEATDADMILRVSSDSPFLDADFIDHLLDALIAGGGDTVTMDGPCAHEGVDPFSRNGLNMLLQHADDDAVAREHVTGYFKLHPGFVKNVIAPPYPALARDGGRLTIDTPDDLKFVEAVYAALGTAPGEALLGDVLSLLDRQPQLRKLNAHIRQKPLTRGRALIRCDGGGKYGYGHVKRMVALARALSERENITVTFALNGTEDALAIIRRAGFEAHAITSHDELPPLIAQYRPDMLLLDGRENPPRAVLESWRAKVPLMAAIDEGGDARLACDFAYYPPVPQVASLDWTGARTVARIGWDWALWGLSPHLTPARALSSRPVLLVAMGGSDPYGLTMRAASALSGLDASFRIRFVIGTGMKNGNRVASAIVAMKQNYETVEGADDLSTEYASADLALCAFGVTAYELAAFGVPAVYLGVTDDHAQSASAFDDAGMGLSLGVADQVSDHEILSAVRALMQDAPRRRQMRDHGLATLDGKGAARIAADLASALAEENAPRAARG